MMRRASLRLLVPFVIALAGCSSAPDTAPRRAEVVSPSTGSIDPNAAQIVEATIAHLGNREFDCSGLVLAAYRDVGIDLTQYFSRYTGNGVSRIYQIAEEFDLLTGGNLQPGDVIIWDNTYDRNDDGEWNDPFTHTGIVTAVSADGVVEFAHAHYREGVVLATMDPNNPDDPEINSAMRMRGQNAGNGLWTAGHLFRDGAALYNLGDNRR